MKRSLLLVAIAAAASVLLVCAPETNGGPGLPLELYVSQAFTPRLASYQASIVSSASDLDRDVVEKSCIVEQVPPTRFVLQENATGALKKAVIFPAASGGQQDLHLKGVSAGKNYLIVIEALSKDDPPQLLASGTALVQDFRAEANATQTISLRGYTLPDGGVSDGGVSKPCDPRIER